MFKQPLAVVRVRYAETDQMGVTYHAAYLPWMEIGRTELLRACGISYRELESAGFMLPVSELHCNYLQPAKYDRLIDIECRLTGIRRCSIELAYRLLDNESGTLLLTGSTRHSCVSITGGRVCRLPQLLTEKLAPLLEPPADQ